jgi:hypothetical protein
MLEQIPQLDPHPLSAYVAWAGHRNRDPILDFLKKKLIASDVDVLEFASGSGMHINYFAPHFPSIRFHPSDKTTETFEYIRGLRDEGGRTNVHDPVVLDLTKPDTWPSPEDRRFAAIFCINIFQVAPVGIADGMMRCAARLLEPEGFLHIYGPFKVDGAYTTPSNEEFDAKLRSAGMPEWGLKDVSDLTKAAADNGLALKERANMPVNNFSLIYCRA